MLSGECRMHYICVFIQKDTNVITENVKRFSKAAISFSEAYQHVHVNNAFLPIVGAYQNFLKHSLKKLMIKLPQRKRHLYI